MNAIHKIDNTVKKYNMLNYGDTVVAGVSGGKDSMLLLYYLINKQKELNLNIICANVEHGIRGESSVNDSLFVRDYCKKHKIRFELLQINAPEEAKIAGEGIEEYSRNKRYEFFTSFNPDKIATAHSLSDNVETLLFRLARGTSLKGVCGIPPVRDNIIRPLIDCTSDEIIKTCRELSIPFVTDETNSDNTYSRNKIRNLAVPVLKSVNPKAEIAIGRFINSAIDDEAFISSFADSFVNRKLYKKDLLSLNISVLRRVFEKSAEKYGVILDEKHLDDVCALLFKCGKCQIKGNLFAFSDREKIYFDYIDESEPVFSLVSKTVRIENLSRYKKEFTFYCDCDKICGDVFARTRKEGDRISPASRNCSKSLKKLFNELKIPPHERDRIPVVCDEKGIIGIFGFSIDDRVKIDKNTASVFLLNIKTEDKN